MRMQVLVDRIQLRIDAVDDGGSILRCATAPAAASGNDR
jgi:hypothetical protein